MRDGRLGRHRRTTGAGRGDTSVSGIAARLLALAGAVVALLAAFAPAVWGGPTAHAASAQPAGPLGSLKIVRPSPSGSVAQGPVGTNVSVEGQGAPNRTYQVGYATDSAACAVFTKVASDTADSSGAFAATFSWPDAANAVGTSYYLCARDAASPLLGTISSEDVFRVLGAAAPAIESVTRPDSSGNPSNDLYRGEPATVVAHNFLPGGTKVLVILTAQQTFSPSDIANGTVLRATNGQDIVSDDQGNVNATVALPNTQQGTRYVHVVSDDGGGTKYLPALEAGQKVEIKQPPAATPTPTRSPTPTPKVTTTTTAGTGGNSGGGSDGNNGGKLVAVLSLAGASAITFILGVIFLASGLATPRSRPAGR